MNSARFDIMMISPLQRFLKINNVPRSRVRQVTGVSRTTVWRWQEGITCPSPECAKALIKLYGNGADGRPLLDYNGCYDKTIDDTL